MPGEEKGGEEKGGEGKGGEGKNGGGSRALDKVASDEDFDSSSNHPDDVEAIKVGAGVQRRG